MFLFLLILTTLPSIYTFRKISCRKDVNVFDLLQIFSLLFYTLAPIKTLFFDLPELRLIYAKDYYTPLNLVFFNTLIFLINFFYARVNARTLSPINISLYLRYWDKKIRISFLHIRVIFVIFLLFLIPLTNYSALTEENLESNITAGYGGGVGYFEKIQLVFIYNIYPVLLLLNFKYIMDKSRRGAKVGMFSYACFCLGMFCAFLATKSVLLILVFFLILYYYSIYRNLINRARLIKIGSVIVFLFFFVFPFSQTFRLVKQSLIMSSGSVDFFEVVLATADMTASVKSEVEDKLGRYSGRTLGVYSALYWANNHSFRGDGVLTWTVVKYLFPQRITSEGSNILGDTYLFKGADIGESILAWYVADWGGIGNFVAILHFLFVFFVWRQYCRFFKFLFRDNKIEFVLIYFYLTIIVNIEVNPAAYLHGFYSQFLIIVAAFSLLFRLVDTFVPVHTRVSLKL